MNCLHCIKVLTYLGVRGLSATPPPRTLRATLGLVRIMRAGGKDGQLKTVSGVWLASLSYAGVERSLIPDNGIPRVLFWS